MLLTNFYAKDFSYWKFNFTIRIILILYKLYCVSWADLYAVLAFYTVFRACYYCPFPFCCLFCIKYIHRADIIAFK